MSIMDRPSNLSIDSDTTNDKVVSLQETGNVEQENLEMGGLVAYIQGRFERSKTRRETDESRWLKSYRNYRGLYGPDVQFTQTEKSRAFIKITKTKVLASYAQIVDVLFAGNHFPIGVEARRYPSNVADAVHIDPQSPEQQQGEGQGPELLRTPVARPGILEKLGIVKKTLDPVKEDVREGAGRTPTSFTW
jgi:hypothetical protein